MAKKRKPPRPDDYFSAGPLHMARFGKNVVFNSQWTEGAFAEFQESLVQRFPEVVAKINRLVTDIISMVSTLPPEQLLQRGYGEMSVLHMGKQSEADFGDEEIHALRMVDYLQSIIAAADPRPDQKDEVSEQDWTRLQFLVEELFTTLNFEYQICRTAVNRKSNPNLDMDVEAFFFKAQMYWCNIRGDRYIYHEERHFRDLLLVHSPVMEDLFGISAQELIESIGKIIRSLTRGMPDAVQELKQFQEATLAKLEPKLVSEPDPTEERMRQLMQQVIQENGWIEWKNDIFGRFFGLDLFDLQKVTELPPHLLKELSWHPGQEGAFLADGEYKGWPLRIWPIFKRPFICLNGKYYCFELYSFLDHFYRIIQRTVCRLKADYTAIWNAKQQEVSEQLPFTYLAQLLPGALEYRQVFYKWNTGGAGGKQWCEADGLLIYDDHLFVVEVKAGAFTYTSPADDFPAYMDSIRNLVLKPSLQGRRFVEYLRSAETVPIFDKDHKQVGKVSLRDFRGIIICPVTLDSFTHLAAQVQHLKQVGIDVGEHPVWAISIDDLRVYSDIFRNPLVFLHFIEQRMRAFRSDIFRSEDELDHLGLYIQHNVYTQYAREFRTDPGVHLNFIGYRSDIDKYYSDLLHDPGTPCPLDQEMPHRLREIVDYLSSSGQTGRAFIAAYLLDCGGDWRENIAQGIDHVLAEQSKLGRPQPLSTHGETRLTIFCSQPPHSFRDAAGAIYHARTVLLAQEEADRILLELEYSRDGALNGIHWQQVGLSGIPDNEIERLQHEAAKLKERRIAKAKAISGKIGRNAPCPCGSGKKYKKCCMP